MDRSKFPGGLGISSASPFAALLKSVIDLLATMGEEAFELLVALLVMILVEHRYGAVGLGIFAYLAACYYVVRYVSAFGVPRFVERETAVLEDDSPQQRTAMAHAYQTVAVTGLIAGVVLIVTAGFDSSRTHVEERLGAYVLLAVLVPLANLNTVKLAILQGLGHHTLVARLRLMRQVVYLAGIYFLVQTGLAPSFLLVAFIPAEVVVAFQTRKVLRAPGIRSLIRRPWAAWATLKKGYTYLFTDNALYVLLNIDIFILGMFAGAWELGVYAEVAVLVRLFLLVPAAFKPILRRYYGLMAANGELQRTARLYTRVTVALFSTAAVAVVCFLLFYPSILDFFFELRGEQRLSLRIFAIIVPGLIFYGAASAQEPVYEILGRAQRLKQLTGTVAAVNLMLTLYFVPLAGARGAAAATMFSMLFYFVLFGRDLSDGLKLPKWTMFVCGLGAYLVFAALNHLDLPGVMTVWLVPLSLVMLFYLSGLFGVHKREENIASRQL